ncbi:hypothetical protein BD769DRAFT_1389115 [Suillus cothurnatus]|nr:hypothetical protein BD769DRAFT_1389115 [Suillus cothurnatus]
MQMNSYSQDHKETWVVLYAGLKLVKLNIVLRSNSSGKAVRVSNQYLTPLGFIINLVAYNLPSWSDTHFVRYEGAMTAIGIEIVGLMMLLRLHYGVRFVREPQSPNGRAHQAYSIICTVNLVLTIMIIRAHEGLKNIAAQLELILTVTMMSRITLNLGKEAYHGPGRLHLQAEGNIMFTLRIGLISCAQSGSTNSLAPPV